MNIARLCSAVNASGRTHSYPSKAHMGLTHHNVYHMQRKGGLQCGSRCKLRCASARLTRVCAAPKPQPLPLKLNRRADAQPA